VHRALKGPTKSADGSVAEWIFEEIIERSQQPYLIYSGLLMEATELAG
jgi:hypothetical protein